MERCSRNDCDFRTTKSVYLELHELVEHSRVSPGAVQVLVNQLKDQISSKASVATLVIDMISDGFDTLEECKIIPLENKSDANSFFLQNPTPEAPKPKRAKLISNSRLLQGDITQVRGGSIAYP